MSSSTTVRRFEIELADSDREVYTSLDLRTAQHPSESDRYLVARVIARALEHADGVDFSKGLSESDEPALWQHDLTGRLLSWIEIGAPSPARLHKATKTCDRVVVYGWKAVEKLAEQLVAEKVHRATDITLYALDQAFLDRLASTLDRHQRWEVSVSGATLYVGVAGATHEGPVRLVVVQ